MRVSSAADFLAGMLFVEIPAEETPVETAGEFGEPPVSEGTTAAGSGKEGMEAGVDGWSDARPFCALMPEGAGLMEVFSMEAPIQTTIAAHASQTAAIIHRRLGGLSVLMSCTVVSVGTCARPRSRSAFLSASNMYDMLPIPVRLAVNLG